MKYALYLIAFLVLLCPVHGETIANGFNGTYTVTDGTVNDGDVLLFPSGSPDYISVTATGSYPEFYDGVPYLNLEAYYPFDGDSDDVTGSHDGTFNGAVDGVFDGIDDYVSIPASGEFNASDWTLSAIVNADDFDQDMTIIDMESVAIRVGKDKYPYIEMFDDTATTETSWGEMRDASSYAHSMTVYQGKLYAALHSGYIYTRGGAPGYFWSSCGRPGSYTEAYAIAVHDGNLYASGGDGVDYPQIYRYDGGTTWTAVGGYDYTYNDYVYELCSFDGKLFAGTDNGNVFYYEDGSITNCGSVGTTTDVRAFVIYKGNLYVSGSGNGVVYRWDGGSTWTSIGDIGATYHINSMVVFDDTIYASLSGSTIGGYVYKWNGVGTTTWTSCGQLGASTELRDLIVYNGDLYGCSYTTNALYKYSGGTTWAAEALGTSTRSASMTIFDGKLMIATQGSGLLYAVGTGKALYGSAMTTGTDYHIIAVNDDSTVTLYQNEVSKGSVGVAFDADTDRSIRIGRAFGTGLLCGSDGAWDGMIHKVGIWTDNAPWRSIALEQSGLLFKPSSDGLYTGYTGTPTIIGIGEVPVHNMTVRNTDGGTNGITAVEYFIVDVNLSNSMVADGLWSFDIDFTPGFNTTDGKITIPMGIYPIESATVSGDSTEISIVGTDLVIDTDTMAPGLKEFAVLAYYSTSGYSFIPADTTVDLVAMEDSQTFEIYANDLENHDFVWYVDYQQVAQYLSDQTSSYDYGPESLGMDVVQIYADGSLVRTWYVDNQVNMTMATQSMSNLNEWNYTLPEYDVFTTMWENNESKSFTENFLDKLATPFTDFWATEKGIGDWVWVGIIVATVVAVHIKVDTLEITCITMIMLSIIVVETQTPLPEPIVYLMYTFIAVGFAGILMALFGGEE